MHGHRLGSAQQGPKILRVSQMIQQQQQRGLVSLSGQRQHILRRCVRIRPHLQDHALVVSLSQPLSQLDLVHFLDAATGPAGKLNDLPHQAGLLDIGAQTEGVELSSGRPAKPRGLRDGHIKPQVPSFTII